MRVFLFPFYIFARNKIQEKRQLSIGRIMIVFGVEVEKKKKDTKKKRKKIRKHKKSSYCKHKKKKIEKKKKK